MLPIDNKTSVNVIQDSIFDQHGLNSIKSMGRDKNPESLREVAKQFEAMFMQQMLKTMRETNEVFAEGNYFDSSQVKFHRDMMDQQMVLNLSTGRGIGLAEHFYQSMMQSYGKFLDKPSTEANTDGTIGSSNAQDEPLKMPELLRYSHIGQSLEMIDPASRAVDQLMKAYYGNSQTSAGQDNVTVKEQGDGEKLPISQSQLAFVSMLKPHAEKAARLLNVNADVLVAQAALETGWGKHVIHSPQGENSFNLFNIKAGEPWQGKSINVATKEVKGNVAYSERADFRQYQSYAESFADYVRLIKNNNRYQQALSVGNNSGAYAEALQDAGYATDPDYAGKIKQLLKSEAISAMSALGKSARSLLSLANQTRQQLME